MYTNTRLCHFSRNNFLTNSQWRPPRSGFFPVGESSLNIINSIQFNCFWGVKTWPGNFTMNKETQVLTGFWGYWPKLCLQRWGKLYGSRRHGLHAWGTLQEWRERTPETKEEKIRGEGKKSWWKGQGKISKSNGSVVLSCLPQLGLSWLKKSTDQYVELGKGHTRQNHFNNTVDKEMEHKQLFEDRQIYERCDWRAGISLKG